MSAVPGAAFLAAGAVLVLLTIVVPIGEDVSLVWQNEDVPDVREVVLAVPRDAQGGLIYQFRALDVVGASGGAIDFLRTEDGLIVAVNVSGLDADPGARIEFRGRTVNRVPDGTYTWFTESTNATGLAVEETATTTPSVSAIESISWFFIDNPAYLAVPFVLGALLLSSVFGCPHLCEPEGAKKGCTSELWLDTFPCGTSAGEIKDVRTGAEIMAWAASRAKKLPVFGATYAEFLKSMPGWVDMTKRLIENKVGTEATVTVICRWTECRTRSCWVFWSRRDWGPGGTAYGPFTLKPPSGIALGTADCFRPDLTAEQLYAAVKKAIDADPEIAEARRKCAKECT